jgi:hypothetical protein
MSLKTGLLGRPERIDRVQRYEDWQQPYFKQMAQQGMQGLQNPTAGFEPMQQETMRQFSHEMPSLMNRIGAIGGMGGSSGHSSAYGQAGSQAYSDLMTRLNAQKAQWGQSNISNYMNMINQGMTQQSDPFFRQRQPGFFENVGNQMLGNVFENGPEMLGKMFGGQDAQGQSKGVGGLPSWMKIAGMFL